MAEKKHDFTDVIRFLGEMSLQLSRTQRATMYGDNVAMLRAEGVDEMARNLLTLSDWLGRLEEFLNCQSGCSEIPTIAEGTFDPPKE